MTLEINTILIDRYRIVSVLGQGGMGSVYKAYDNHLDVFVAIKENLYLSEEYTRQFQKEASILASLHAAHLPHVADYFLIPNQGQYILMDYIEGDDLRTRIETQGIISEKEAAIIGALICDALDYLHTRPSPIIHRDIKPGNIKITPDGDVFLVDFGLAKIMADNQATLTGARAMTPGYSPPEQYGTARTDPRSDIYSLGATLYASVTGTIPEDSLERATGKQALTPVRSLNPAVSQSLATAIEQALDTDPDQRFQTALEFKQALLTSCDLLQYNLPRMRLKKASDSETIHSVFSSGTLPDSHDADKNQTPSGWPVFGQALQQLQNIPTFFPVLLAALILFAIAGTGFFLRNSIIRPASKTDPTLNTGAPSDTPRPILHTATASVLPAAATQEQPVTPMSLISPAAESEKRIAFVSNRTGTFQIWMMSQDGSRQIQFSNLEDGACQPDWSPDGNFIAVISPCKDRFQQSYPDANIYLINTTTGETQPLIADTPPGNFHPAWSPDGKRIAFSSIRSGVPHLFLYNFEDQNLGELSDTRYPDILPAWNPSGKQIAFSRKNAFNHIFMMSDRGQTQFQFSSMGNINDYWADWSSDGSFLIYSRISPDTAIPFLVKLKFEDRGTGKEERIPGQSINGLGPIAFADLSPDDQSILFESWPDGHNHDIYFMNLDGTDLLRLTTDPGLDFQPVWEP